MNSKQKKELGKLKELYSQIPQVEGCKEGCGQCCGPSPVSQVEALRLNLPEGTKTTSAGGFSLDCSLLCSETKSCTKYNERPFLCRLFAASKSATLTCPFGARAKKPISEKRSAVLRERYIALMKV